MSEQEVGFLAAGVGRHGVGKVNHSAVEPSQGVGIDETTFVETKMAAVLLLDVQEVRLLLWNKNEACQPEVAIKTKVTREFKPKKEWGNG